MMTELGLGHGTRVRMTVRESWEGTPNAVIDHVDAGDEGVVLARVTAGLVELEMDSGPVVTVSVWDVEVLVGDETPPCRGTLPDSRRAITGDLTVLREYSCGCIIYLDAAKQEINEKGIFCGHNSWPKHRSALLKGQETQVNLFPAG